MMNNTQTVNLESGTLAMNSVFATDTQVKQSKSSQDELRWNAIVARDRSLDRTFVFAVRSTGIYCRPSCPARRPLRVNVQFFPEPAMAEQQGYRACKRCLPNAPLSSEEEKVLRACRIIERAMASPGEVDVDLTALSAAAGLSPEHFQRVFRRVIGVSPKQFVTARRMSALRKSLRVDDDDVASATYAAGFGSGSRVYERTDAELGMSPGVYRRGAPGVSIQFTIAETSLGKLLVAATKKGICSVKIGSDANHLELELREEFMLADVMLGATELKQWLKEIVRRVDGGETKSALPLDIRVTAFQRQVYAELMKIPRGETRTYAQVAASVGRPQAHRAVARACATNQVAIVIPCHRVVRSDGSLSGYRWGAERKLGLLEREAAHRNQKTQAKIG